MKVSAVMTRSVSTASSHETIEKAAVSMRKANVGILPVMEGARLIGIVTDRDIVVRGVATGASASKSVVGDLMTEEVHFCLEDDEIEDVIRRMGETRVRRMPVLDRRSQFVGIVSLDDLAASIESQHAVVDALRKIRGQIR